VVSFIEIEMCEDIVPTLPEKHLSQAEDQVVLKQQPVARKIEILLLGYLDNPVVKCMKQLYNFTAKQDMISLAVKKSQGIQKFKLPFKNASSYLDSDVEFAFIRTPNPESTSDSNQMLPIDCLQFYCQPNQLKIGADQISVLTVQIKVNTEVLEDEDQVDPRLMKQACNKLLVARLKNSQVLFSFFISICLID